MQRDITITCRNKHCKQTTATHNVHYVLSHNIVTHNNPMHCPMCPASNTDTTWITSRKFDYTDTLCIKFPKLPRPLASAMIDQYNNTLHATYTRTHHNDTPYTSVSTVNLPCQFDSVEDLITQSLPIKLLTSNGITPIHVKCNDCLSTITILRTNPTAISTLPRYCIWCSSSHLTITLPTTDETSQLVLNLDLIEQQLIEELAQIHNIPLLIMQALYEQWQAQQVIRTIKDWMLTPSVQHIINTINKATPATSN